MKNRITSAAKQGPRSYQEDFHFHLHISSKSGVRGELLAVMDGHSGAEAAALCAREIKNHFRISRAAEAETALKRLVKKLAAKTEHMNSGSTLSLALVVYAPLQVSVAILGDSPVVVFDKQSELHLSPEHNVRSNLDERRAAEKRGGFYDRGYIYERGGIYGLQMSRALGDAHLGEILSREPEVYTIAKPAWVLVASDGLFDPSHKETTGLMEEIKDFAVTGATAEQLMEWADGRELQDNATALVWRLKAR